MVAVKRNFTLQDFEHALAEIFAGDQNLLMPNEIRDEALSARVALIQLVVTWARTAGENRLLQLYARSVDDPFVLKFSKDIAGLIALNFANKIQFYYGKNDLARRDAMEVGRPLVDAINSGSLSELRSLDKSTLSFLCIDNSKELRRPAHLYDADGEVRDRKEFVDLLTSCYEELGPRNYLSRAQGSLTSAARIIYEAFLNTHEHAQTDFRGDILSRSVRGVLVGKRTIDINTLVQSAVSHKPLQKYFKNWRVTHDQQKALFMDLSVFDSGSGLAQTWLANKGQIERGIIEDGIPLDVEYDAVQDCLRKGFTTKRSYTSGNGLYRIMEVVRRAGGYLRIRTGRLSLIRAFPMDTISVDVNDIMMEDALNGGRPAQPLAWAEGTTISVLLPLNRSAN